MISSWRHCVKEEEAMEMGFPRTPKVNSFDKIFKKMEVITHENLKMEVSKLDFEFGK